MTEQLTPIMRGGLSRIIDSPLQNFIEDFFGSSLPLTLVGRQETYPKYNIFRKSNDITDEFTIELALAGFSKEELKVSVNDNILYVESIKSETIKKELDYLYKGIAERDFKWSLRLPEYAVLDKVKFIDGILAIDIKIDIPEEKKPKTYIIE
jgi:molecular chaperone IbpA